MRIGIYIHHPWCVRKCAYCAFNVYTDPKPPFEDWFDGILRDWAEEKKQFSSSPYSIYFGGGTPSLAPPQIICDVISTIQPQEQAEITLEINPGDLQKEHLLRLQKSGVNRYSIGIQSFNKKFSRLLNRSHTVADNHDLLILLRDIQPKTWSLDLIFGLPDQSLDELKWDLEQALIHNPPHISIYGLTVEEGTPLAKSVKRGRTKPLDEDKWSEQFAFLMDYLEHEGYVQYEISNFARPGHRSTHNEHIWKNGHYVGLGPGAHGFRPNGQRTIQHPKWENWMQDDHLAIEYPSSAQAMIDRIITQLRHIDGFPLSELQKKGLYIPSTSLLPMQREGWISIRDNSIRIEKKGRFFCDWISQKIIAQIHTIAV